jgi:catechol 2,3-dioxygenase-like lactoylglutathione lyase family enzyme
VVPHSALIRQLDHLNLTVSHLDETVAWYGRVFGFVLVERDVQDGVE